MRDRGGAPGERWTDRPNVERRSEMTVGAGVDLAKPHLVRVELRGDVLEVVGHPYVVKNSVPELLKRFEALGAVDEEGVEPLLEQLA